MSIGDAVGTFISAALASFVFGVWQKSVDAGCSMFTLMAFVSSLTSTCLHVANRRRIEEKIDRAEAEWRATAERMGH